MKRSIFRFFAVFLITLIALIAFNFDKVKRLNHVIHLFDAEVITQNFQNMEASFPVSELKASKNPLQLPAKDNIELPEKFTYHGEEFDIANFLKESNTEGFLIIQNDTIIYENYTLDLEENETYHGLCLSLSCQVW